MLIIKRHVIQSTPKCIDKQIKNIYIYILPNIFVQYTFMLITGTTMLSCYLCNMLTVNFTEITFKVN